MLPFTLQQLRILKAIATEKSFTKAAQLLYISQPALSTQLKKLEKNLDILLIHREKAQISLTDNGIIFLQYAERILGLCEESYRVLTDLKHGECGTLKIGVTQPIGAYVLPRVLLLFNQKYPQFTLKIRVSSTRIISKNLMNHKIDLAIINGEVSENLKKNLTVKKFIEDEFSLIIPSLHPLASKKQINKEDLYHLSFITLNSNSEIQKFIETTLSQNQIEINQLKIIMQINSIEGIKTAVGLNLGAAFVPFSTIEKEIELKTIQILKIKNIRISQTSFIINNPKCYKSKAFEGVLSRIANNKK